MIKRLFYDARKVAKRLGVDGVSGTLPLSPEADELGLDKHFEVLRHCRLGQSDLPDKILDATVLCRAQMPEQTQPRWMRQCCQLARHGIIAGVYFGLRNFHRSSAIYDE